MNGSLVSDKGPPRPEFLSEISQTDDLMLFGIHFMKEYEIAIKLNFNNVNKFFFEFSFAYSFYYWIKFQGQGK